MSLPPVPPPVAAGPLNPIEAFITSVNTNSYVIGMMMILLNLGGRHLAMGLTPEQDKLFQGVWARRFLLFVVIFIATRNIFTALWLSIGLILVIGYLFNEHSQMYLFGEPKPMPESLHQMAPKELTPEEQEIYKRLHDKVQRVKKSVPAEVEKEEELHEKIIGWYETNMKAIQSFIA